MSVLDNMMLGASDQAGERLVAALVPGRWRTQERAVEVQALELLRPVQARRPSRRLRRHASPGGQRKLLEMARALMATPT